LDPDAVWDGDWGRSGMGVLDGGDDRRTGRGSFGGEFEASYCNQWGLRCVVVRERRALLKLLWEDLFLIERGFTVWLRVSFRTRETSRNLLQTVQHGDEFLHAFRAPASEWRRRSWLLLVQPLH